MKSVTAYVLWLLLAVRVEAGNWAEFRSLVGRAQSCVARHPGQLPRLESNLRRYESRLGEADAFARLNPALADGLIARPLAQLREELAACAQLEARSPSGTRPARWRRR